MALKKTSEIFTISTRAAQTAVDGFVEQEINLSLNILDQEILAIYAVDVDMSQPDADATVATQDVSMSLTATTQTAVSNISEPTCIAAGQLSRKNDAVLPALGDTVALFQSSNTPVASDIPWIYLVATDNMYLQLDSNNAGTTKSANVRIWAQRMKADAATYAALVNSELAGQ